LWFEDRTQFEELHKNLQEDLGRQYGALGENTMLYCARASYPGASAVPRSAEKDDLRDEAKALECVAMNKTGFGVRT